MGYNRKTAKSLLTEAEYELFVSSLPDNVAELTKEQLRSGITRSRRARDKFTDVHRRQSGATRSRAGSRGTALGKNLRTSQKADVFSEALARFESQLEKLELADAAASRGAALERAQAAKAPRPNRAARRAKKAGKDSGPGSGFTTEGAKAAHRRSSTLGGPTSKHISAARSAAGRRTQAKRDAR